MEANIATAYAFMPITASLLIIAAFPVSGTADEKHQKTTFAGGYFWCDKSWGIQKNLFQQKYSLWILFSRQKNIVRIITEKILTDITCTGSIREETSLLKRYNHA